jgi:hypothetical protein
MIKTELEREVVGMDLAEGILSSIIELHLLPRTTSNSGSVAEKERYESGLEKFVAVMQPTDLWDGDHFSDPWWHDGARVGTILIE